MSLAGIPAAPNARRTWRVAASVASVVGAIALSAGLVVWMTWPFPSHIGDGPPGLGFYDWLYTTWTLSWQLHALLTGTPIANANIYAPAPDTLYYGVLATGLLPFYAAAYLLSGRPIASIELAYLAALVATGVSVHLVVRAWTGSWLPGAVAATALLVRTDVVAQTGLAPQWAALAAFAPLMLVVPRARSAGAAALVALVAAAQCLTEAAYIAPAVLAVLGTCAVLYLLPRATRAVGGRLLVATAATPLLVLPMFAGLIRTRLAHPALADQSVWALGVPYAGFWATVYVQQAAPLMVAWIGMAVAATLAARYTAQRRPDLSPPSAWSCTLVLVVVPIVLLRFLPVIGEVVPVVMVVRDTRRFAMASMVGLGLLAGLAFSDVAAAVRARFGRAPVLPLAALAVGILVSWPATVPRYTFPISGVPRSLLIMERLAGTGPVLVVPPDYQPTRPAAHAWAMYASLSHWRPLLNGYASYFPEGWDDRMALAARLPDPAILARLVRETGVTTIVVPFDFVSPVQARRWRLVLQRRPPELVPEVLGQWALVFRVNRDALPAT